MNPYFPNVLARLVRKNRTIKTARARVALSVETLEDHLVPATINVNSFADLLNPAAGVVTLRSAIQAANNSTGDITINLTLPGTYRITTFSRTNQTDNAAGELAILDTGSHWTIQNTSGGNVIIDGGGLNRVFDLNPTASSMPFTVTFQSVIITDGNAAPGDLDRGSGGGIRAQGGANVILNNVLVTGNTATADGGGVALESVNHDSTGILIVNASTISYNQAGDAGGGIESDGSGPVAINAGSIVSFNTCVNQGAGIWLDAGTAALNVTGALISNNHALTMLAGGIGNAGSGSITIKNSLFQDNFAGGAGGAFADAANVSTLMIQDCYFIRNTAVGDGGAVQEGSASVRITNATFEQNVSQGTGGALQVSGMNIFVVTVKKSLFHSSRCLLVWSWMIESCFGH
jgi:hypothetical protein